MTDTLIADVGDDDFDRLVATSDVPLLVDFMAPWCGPCTQMAPILEQIAAEFAGALQVCKMDVDRDPETARRLGIRGLPTLLLLHRGAEVQRETGTLTKTRIAAMVDRILD